MSSVLISEAGFSCWESYPPVCGMPRVLRNRVRDVAEPTRDPGQDLCESPICTVQGASMRVSPCRAESHPAYQSRPLTSLTGVALLILSRSIPVDTFFVLAKRVLCGGELVGQLGGLRHGR